MIGLIKKGQVFILIFFYLFFLSDLIREGIREYSRVSKNEEVYNFTSVTSSPLSNKSSKKAAVFNKFIELYK